MTSKLDLFSATPPQEPTHANRSHVPLIGKILVSGIVLSGVIAIPQIDQVTSRANASGLSEKVSLYLSAPMVQGTNVAGADKESFNALTTGACPTSVNGVSSISFTNSGVAATTSAQIEQVCKVEPWIRSVGSGEGTIYGGASATRRVSSATKDPTPGNPIPGGQTGGASPPNFWLVQVIPSCQAASVQLAGNWPRTLRVNLASPASDTKSTIGISNLLFLTQGWNATRNTRHPCSQVLSHVPV
jgi:hypothetical protein